MPHAAFRQCAVVVDVCCHSTAIYLGRDVVVRNVYYLHSNLCLLFLPARMVLVGDTKGFLHSASIMHWGMMATVFALSHVAYLLTLPGVDAKAGALLVIFLVATTELNDISQYLWGNRWAKSKSRRKSAQIKRLPDYWVAC